MSHTAERAFFVLHTMTVPEAFSSLVPQVSTYSTSAVKPFCSYCIFHLIAHKHDFFLTELSLVRYFTVLAVCRLSSYIFKTLCLMLV